MPFDSSIYSAASALLAEFAWRADRGEPTVAELFVEDAVVETPHVRLAGREAIHDWFTRRDAEPDRITRHNSINLRVTPLGDDRFLVHANSFNITAQADSSPAQSFSVSVGTTEDIMVDTVEGLRFAYRRHDVVIKSRLGEAGLQQAFGS